MKKIFLFTIIALSVNIINAQWQQTNGPFPFSGTVNSLIVSGTKIFAGTDGGGIYLSNNNGTSWNPVNTGLTNNIVTSLAVSDTYIFAGTQGGVFLSSNNGTPNWTAINNGLTYTNVYSLAVNSNNIFAGTEWGVFLSTNNGSSWANVSNDGLENYIVRSLVINGTNIFAGTNGGGVFFSSNNGTNWTAVNTGLTNLSIKTLAVNGNNLFAGTGYNGVYLSSNNGISWTWLSYFDVNVLAISGTNIFAGTNGGVYLSTNNGVDWSALNTGLPFINSYPPIVNSLAINGTNIFAGTNYCGIYLSNNNGTSWSSANIGLANTGVRSLVLSGTDILAGTYGKGVFLSSNNGTSWQAVYPESLSDTNVNSLLVFNNSLLFAGTNSGGVFKTYFPTTGGWYAVNNGLTNTNVSSLVKSGPKIYAGTNGSGVFLSTNTGTDWTAVNTGLTNLNIKSLAVYGNNIYAGTNGSGVFLSTNDGTDWAAVNTGLTYLNVMSLAVNGSNIFAGTNGGGVFLSTNNGTSWSAMNIGLNTTVRTLVISGNNIFAGTQGGGVFLSINNGVSWSAFNTDLSSNSVWSLAISGANIFAGTIISGAWKQELLPYAVTNIATNIQTSTATLNGSVYFLNNLPTTISFEYDTSINYNNSVNAIPFIIDNSSNVSAVVSGLTSNTIYHFRVKAVDSTGTYYGSDSTFKTRAESAWELFNGGFDSNIVTVRHINIVDSNIVWFAGGNNRHKEFTRTMNGGATFSNGFILPSDTLYNIANIHALSYNKAYACLFPQLIPTGGKILHTTDGGLTWSEQTTADFTNSWADFVYFWDDNNGICIGDPVNNEYVIYTTSDGGNQWISIPGTEIPDGLSNEAALVECFDIFNDIIWFTTTQGRVYKSTDKGHTWSVSAAFSSTTNNYRVRFKDANTGFVISGALIKKTTDGGLTWNSVTPTGDFLGGFITPIPGSDSLWVNVNYSPQTSLGIGSSISYDNCNTFHRIDYEVPYEIVDFYNSRNGWAGGYVLNNIEGGIYKWPAPFLYSIEKQQLVYNDLKNYPNPFSNATVIKYFVSTKSKVIINIYDVIGNNISTLVNEDKLPGSYEINFDGSELKSGIYFFKVSENNSVVQTGKMVLSK